MGRRTTGVLLRLLQIISRPQSNGFRHCTGAHQTNQSSCKCMTTWFTSDIHFGHRNIITHCSRPYTTVEEMNEALIFNWLRVVKPEDIIFILGDFSFEKHPENIFRRLSGTKVLIRGNHDHEQTIKLPWDAVHDYFEFKIDSDVICMSHFPMLSWHWMHRNSYVPRPLSWHVGVPK